MCGRISLLASKLPPKLEHCQCLPKELPELFAAEYLPE